MGIQTASHFFSATAHVRCTAPAGPTPRRGRCRSAYCIFYWQNDTVIVISLQHASNCIKNTILSLFYIKLVVVYYSKPRASDFPRSRKSRGIADLKRNPWNPFARHNLRQPVTMTGWRAARIDVAQQWTKKTPRAKTMNLFWACLGAQFTICAQKRRKFVCSSTLSLRFVWSRD